MSHVCVCIRRHVLCGLTETYLMIMHCEMICTPTPQLSTS